MRPSPRPGRFVLPALEGLEERCVTTVFAGVGGAFGNAVPTLVGRADGAAVTTNGTGLVFTGSFAAAQTTAFRDAAGEGASPLLPESWQLTGGASAEFPASQPAAWPAGPPSSFILVTNAATPGTVAVSLPAPQGIAAAPTGTGQGGAAAPPPGLPVGPSADAGLGPPSAAPPGPAAASGLAGHPAVDNPIPVVAARFTPAPTLARPDGLPDAQAGAFRITRASAGDAPLEVRFTLTTYTSAGAAFREGLATIPRGSDHVDIPVEPGRDGLDGEPEIVTLSVRGNDSCQDAQPTVTAFVAGDARRCSNEALFEAYRLENSGDAFRALVERHRPAVLQACYRVLGSWADADDVSQLVFLALARRTARLPALLPGWLATVARNAAIVLLRSRTRRSRHEKRAARPVAVAAEETAFELREELAAALTQLPDPLREAVRLRYLEGLSQLEAARVAGCPRGTLSRRAAHGLDCLRAILGGRTGGAWA